MISKTEAIGRIHKLINEIEVIFNQFTTIFKLLLVVVEVVVDSQSVFIVLLLREKPSRHMRPFSVAVAAVKSINN